jgi:protein dithiol oxidoreductase (disulfide-forming)
MRGPMRALVASLLSLLSLACSAQNSSASFEEGKHFKAVKSVVKPTDPKRITVEEFFWYGCQHCYHFEPDIGGWAKSKPADVDFVRVPASLGRPEGVLHQKAYYTAEALGVTEKVHKALFDAIHEKHQPLATQPALAAFFNSQVGVLPDVFNGTFIGFAVDSRVRRADQLGKDYMIFSVPTLVVGGKYQTTAQMAGGTYPKMIEVMSFLIEKVRKERKN